MQCAVKVVDNLFFGFIVLGFAENALLLCDFNQYININQFSDEKNNIFSCLWGIFLGFGTR